jgi:restriction system protein
MLLARRFRLLSRHRYKEPVGVSEISQHIVRVMGRAGAHGIVISASDFSEPAVQIARDFLQQKILVLGTLAELVHVLEQKAELAEYWEKKIHAAQLYKNPASIRSLCPKACLKGSA